MRTRIARAAAACGRDPASVLLVAVAKGVTPERVDAAIAGGATDIGENRVQEAEAKRATLRGRAAWHLIGHLQTNKAKRAAELFDVVQSVDSTRVAEALAAASGGERDPLDVLIEVELTGIASRSGAQPSQLEPLARALLERDRLHLGGLMTIAAPVDDPADAAPYFERLRRLRDDLEQRLGVALPALSMGMTDDFEVAIAAGATIVRVGRAIFGRAAEPPGDPAPRTLPAP